MVNKTSTLALNKINVAEGFNVRDNDTEENRQNLAELIDSIKENGLYTPLAGYYNEDKQFILTRGHSRLRALQALDWKEPVPVVLDDRAETEEERIAGLILDNSGKPLSPLEAAEVFRRLTAMGLTQEAVAKRTGVTAMTVSSGLKVLKVPSAVAAINKGLTTATEAYECIKVLESKKTSAKQIENWFKTQIDAAKKFNRKTLNEAAEKAAPYFSKSAQEALLDIAATIAAGASNEDVRDGVEAFCETYAFEPTSWFQERDAEEERERNREKAKEEKSLAAAAKKVAAEEKKAAKAAAKAAKAQAA